MKSANLNIYQIEHIRIDSVLSLESDGKQQQGREDKEFKVCGDGENGNN